MDVNTVLQLISNIGFPIVCCGALFFYVREHDAQHKAEVDKLSEAVSNNTKIMERIAARLDLMGGDK